MEKRFNWDSGRNRQLVDERDISFEDVVFSVHKGGLLDVLRHTQQAAISRLRVLVVEIDAYVYLVPCIETDDMYFMLTITPSRKATRQYLTGDV